MTGQETLRTDTKLEEEQGEAGGIDKWDQLWTAISQVECSRVPHASNWLQGLPVMWSHLSPLTGCGGCPSASIGCKSCLSSSPNPYHWLVERQGHDRQPLQPISSRGGGKRGGLGGSHLAYSPLNRQFPPSPPLGCHSMLRTTGYLWGATIFFSLCFSSFPWIFGILQALLRFQKAMPYVVKSAKTTNLVGP